MADEIKKYSILDVEAFFDKNLKDLDIRIGELSKFYDIMYNHYLEVMNQNKVSKSTDLNVGNDVFSSGPKKPLSFIHQQLANLNDLQKQKTDLIKQKYEIQKHKSNLLLKLSQLEKDESRESVDDVVLSLLKGITTGDIIVKKPANDERLISKEESDKKIEEMLNMSNHIEAIDLTKILIIRNTKNIFLPVEIVNGSYKKLNIDITSIKYYKTKNNKIYRDDTKEEVPLLNF